MTSCTRRMSIKLDAAFYQVTHGPWSTTGDDVQYRIEANGKLGRLFFQCSRSDADWKNNLNFPALPYKRMSEKWYVHGGFLKAWKSCRDSIAQKVEHFDVLEIYGYSIGGAMAVLAHEDFVFSNGILPNTVTFGCPNVLWGKTINRFDNVLNYRVRGDIVGMLPPTWLGYHVPGTTKMMGPHSWPSVDKHKPEAYRKYLEA